MSVIGAAVIPDTPLRNPSSYLADSIEGSPVMSSDLSNGQRHHPVDPSAEAYGPAPEGRRDRSRAFTDLSGRFHHALYDRWILGPDRSGRFRTRRGRAPIEGIG